ncbi:leucyl/phenylalanyl-tRNA--protein transferase [bacterium]|nr:leucyl/phenylalanyl-tRNA--protein transferase [bacterium]
MKSSQLTPELLLAAYSQGLFPMAEGRHEDELNFYCPKQRALIPLDERFNIPRGLKRFLRNDPFTYRIDTACEQVIAACAERSEGTWINDAIIAHYTALHRMGFVHSVEAWQEGGLVGGLYGVAIGGAFCGESMFSRVPEASKSCLVQLVNHLRKQGFTLLDSQLANDHLRPFGMVELPAKTYEALLAEAIALDVRFA